MGDQNMTTVNAIGDACPLPVVKTKRALAELPSGTLTVLVDNEVAVENLRRFAASAGCDFSVEAQGDHFHIELLKPESTGEAAAEAQGSIEGKTVVILASDTMGGGDAELGAILMKGFVFALTQLDTLPDTILLYNTGARLSVEGAVTLDDLKALADAGVSVMTCGTCLNHFGIADALGVGEVTNMYSIVEEMRRAARILRP